MPLIRADRVKESSTSTSTSAFLLNGADSTYRTFASVCAVGDTVYYAIAHRSANEWEVGLGTYSAVNTLTRTTVHASSNANAAVAFSAGTKDVLLALTKTQLETYATLAGTETLTNKTISGANNTITNVSLTAGVTGTLPLANGGTGTTTAQLAINALAGAVTSGSYLRGNGTNVVMATIAAGDVPTLNQNTTGTASGSVSGTASYVPKFTSANVVGNSQIYDNGTSVGIGTASPNNILHVYKAAGSAAIAVQAGAAYAYFINNQTDGILASSAGTTGNKIRYNLNAPDDSIVLNSSGNVGIGTASPSVKLQTVGAVRSSGYTDGGDGTYLELTGDLPGYPASRYPTLRSDGSIYFAVSGRYSAYFNSVDNSLNIANTATQWRISLHPSGTSYFAGGALAVGSTTAPSGQLYVTPQAAATKGLVVRGASAQSANLQEWQDSAGTALAYISSSGILVVPEIYAPIITDVGGVGYYKQYFITRTLPDTVGDYVEFLEYAHTVGTRFKIDVMAADYPYWDSATYEFNSIWDNGSCIMPPKFRYHRNTSDLVLEKVYGQTNPYVSRLRLRRIGAKSHAGSTTVRIRVEVWTASVGGFPTDASATGTSTLSSYGSDQSFCNPSLQAPPQLVAGNASDLSLYGASANGTGNGGNILLQAGAFSTSGSNGKVIVRGLASNTANLQEWQNNAGTVLAYVSSNASVIGTPSNCFIGANDNSGGQIVLYGAAGGYGIGLKTTSLGAEVIRFNSGQLLITIGQGGNNAGLLVNGNLGASGSVASFVNVGNVASKGIVVKGVASQTGNLQEWQNNAGSALAYVTSAGDIVGAGGAISTGAGNGTDGYGESGPVVLVNKWLAYNTGSIYFNIRKLYGTRAFPATYANGDYVEIAKIYRQGFHPITLTIHAAHGAVNGAASKVYVITPDYNFGNWTAAPLSGGKVGDFDFDVELVAPDPYTLAIRVRRHSSSTPTYANIIFTIESHNYNRGGMVELSGTGNSASALPYRSDYMRIGPTVSAPTPVGGSGAGTDLAIYAGSAIGTGAGGSILLQAGAFATSGSNGKVIVRGLASNTANLQEWQNNAGTVLASVTSAGHAYFGSVYVGSGSGTGSYSTGVGSGALFASTTGYGNTAVGAEALAATTTTSEATAVGWKALESGTGGGTAVGIYALRGATGGGNTAIGNYAGQHVGSGTNNVLAGASVGPQAVTLSSVFIGTAAGRWQSDENTAHTGGSRSVHVGYQTAGASVGDYNTIVIGYKAASKGQNTTVIGNTSTVSTDVFGTLTTTLGASTQKGIVVKGASGQSANLLELQNNAGAVLSAVNSAGSFTNNGGYSYSEEFGNAATVTNQYATAIGYGTTAGQLSTAVGSFAVTSGVTSTAIGAEANADGGSTAVGRQATASGGSATAIGVNANAVGNNSIAIGRLAASNGGIAIGYNFTGAGLGYTSFCASVNGTSTTGAIAVYAGDGANNGNFSRQHSILGTWATATYASRLGRVQLRVNDYTTDREAIRYESDGASALTSIGGSAVIASTTLAVQPAVSGNKGIVVKGASGQSANLLELQNSSGQIGLSVSVNQFGEATFVNGPRYISTAPEFSAGLWLQYQDSTIDRTNVRMHVSASIGFAAGSASNTSLDTYVSRGDAGVLRVNAASGAGGSIAITSNTPAAFTADQNNLALTASGFQRLSGTAARNITGIAPPSGSHVDGRMIRIYNVGTFNLTLKHNSTSSTAANRFWNVQAIDIIVGANDYAELIYDGTNNGSGAAGWRVA